MGVGGLRSFIDISVPRNIDPKIDDLKEVVAANKKERAKAAAEAEELITEELLEFEMWRDSLEAVPTIKALRAKAEAIRIPELEKAFSRLGNKLSNKQIKAVEELSKSIVNKLLHGPMTGLRCNSEDPNAMKHTLLNIEALDRMFLLAEFAEQVEAAVEQ